jgi:hypothetical protein
MPQVDFRPGAQKKIVREKIFLSRGTMLKVHLGALTAMTGVVEHPIKTLK